MEQIKICCIQETTANKVKTKQPSPNVDFVHVLYICLPYSRVHGTIDVAWFGVFHHTCYGLPMFDKMSMGIPGS